MKQKLKEEVIKQLEEAVISWDSVIDQTWKQLSLNNFSFLIENEKTAIEDYDAAQKRFWLSFPTIQQQPK